MSVLYKRGDTELTRAAWVWPQPVGLTPGCGIDPTLELTPRGPGVDSICGIDSTLWD